MVSVVRFVTLDSGCLDSGCLDSGCELRVLCLKTNAFERVTLVRLRWMLPVIFVEQRGR